MLKFEEPPTYTESDALVLFSPEMNDNLDGLTPLSRPVCVPQVDPSFDSPFVRAYPPALASSGIAMVRSPGVPGGGGCFTLTGELLGRSGWPSLTVVTWLWSVNSARWVDVWAGRASVDLAGSGSV